MPHTHDNSDNHGVITGSRSTAFAGGIVPYVIRNESGNWQPFLPGGEKQSNNNTDTMACVTFSLLNCIETQEFFLTGKRINYSDRWIAKMSGTTPYGNYLQTVANTVQQYGLVKEESWPTPQNYTWDSYYADPDPATLQKLLLEGREWLKSHKLETDWLTTDKDVILKHLKQCPSQIVRPGHAIENFYTEQEVVNYFDSYVPYEKQVQRSVLTDVFKIYLTIKTMRLVNDAGTIYLVGDKGKIGFADMAALEQIKALTTEPIENGSTAGIPQIKIMETGFTFHN